jgi:enamine deaminase RidA (YjgF/YER057c/UK114 family)
VTAEPRRISSGSPYERAYGYSRAIAVGDGCWVAGTTDAGADGTSTHPGDAAGQARAAFGIAIRALEEAGFAAVDVVRVRMYVVRAEDAAPVAAVNGELFGEIRPAATLVRVAGLIDPSLLVEVELEARRPASSSHDASRQDASRHDASRYDASR